MIKYFYVKNCTIWIIIEYNVLDYQYTREMEVKNYENGTSK